MSKEKVITIGLCGFGTVGQGVWKHLKRCRPDLESRLGGPIKVGAIAVRDLKKKREVKAPARLISADAMAVATDRKIDIVCELIGGTTYAKKLTLAALRAGKVVVSANKALICDHGAEIFRTARKHSGHFFFEASVAGGIPIIKALREGLVANKFPQIYGILNGTCNFILTKMEALDAPYGDILQDAKDMGYAEADEALDVQGWDTAHKAAIICWLAHGVWIGSDKMIVEGIEKITPQDFKNASALGYEIKLIAIISRDFKKNEICVRVHPTLLPAGNVVANVNGVFNGVSITGDVVGTTQYIGQGAGQDATTSAVIGDIADAVALIRNGKGLHLSEVSPSEEKQVLKLAPLENIRSCYYLRLTVRDQPGVLAKVTAVMAKHKVNIASVIQTLSESEGTASLVLTTHESDEKAMGATLSQVSRLAAVVSKPLLLRISDFTE